MELPVTDQLARHPGRPWRVDGGAVPEDVVEHYTKLSTAELVDAVLEHYQRNVWPIVDAIIHSRLNNPFDFGLVFEGSAILPEQVRNAGYARVRAVWLTAPHELITERIWHNSNYETSTTRERAPDRRFFCSEVSRSMRCSKTRLLRTLNAC